MEKKFARMEKISGTDSILTKWLKASSKHGEDMVKAW
jgi:hypothetical protein